MFNNHGRKHAHGRRYLSRKEKRRKIFIWWQQKGTSLVYWLNWSITSIKDDSQEKALAAG